MLLIPYASDQHGQLVHANNAEREQKLLCPKCQNPVILKRGEIKIPHFAHKYFAENNCTSESVQHQIAKQLIKQSIESKQMPSLIRKCQHPDRDITAITTFPYRKDRVYDEFPKCQGTIKQKIPEKVKTAQLEYPINNHRVDVALLNEHARVLSGIEIYHTHAVDEAKSEKLTIPWIELKAEDIINDQINWKVINEGNLNPAICQNCKNLKNTLKKEINRITQATNIKYNSQCYTPKLHHCWRCEKEMVLFTWENNKLYSTREPKASPRPWTIVHREHIANKKDFWTNICPYCKSVQGKTIMNFYTTLKAKQAKNEGS